MGIVIEVFILRENNVMKKTIIAIILGLFSVNSASASHKISVSIRDCTDEEVLRAMGKPEKAHELPEKYKLRFVPSVVGSPHKADYGDYFPKEPNPRFTYMAIESLYPLKRDKPVETFTVDLHHTVIFTIFLNAYKDGVPSGIFSEVLTPTDPDYPDSPSETLLLPFEIKEDQLVLFYKLDKDGFPLSLWVNDASVKTIPNPK